MKVTDVYLTYYVKALMSRAQLHLEEMQGDPDRIREMSISCTGKK